jgi:hypothetical protein
VRYRSTRLALAIVVAVALVAPWATARAQDAATPQLDLAALAVRPGDVPEPGWRHAGAFVSDLAGQAEAVAAYRSDASADEVAERLATFGWQRMSLSVLDGPPGTGATPVAGGAESPDRRIRSYVAAYATAEGAAAGFAYLEDETSIPTAVDRPLDRPVGDQAEMTEDTGTGADGRPFRSLDLTFRLGALVGGVTLVAYGGAADDWPDAAVAAAMAATLEARLRAPDAAPGLGARVARIAGRPPAVLAYDDAYYRIDGTDIPLADEADSAAAARAHAYARAVDVYQLWQGVGVGGPDGVLYGATLLLFPDEAEASAWLGELADLLRENPFYGAVQPLSAPEGTVALRYVAGGGSPDAPGAVLVAVRVGATAARVHVVPLEPVLVLAESAAACLAGPTCPELTGLPDGLGTGSSATPVATTG